MNIEESKAYDIENQVWFIGEYVGHSLLGNHFLNGENIYFRPISIPSLEDESFTKGFCIYVDSGFCYIDKELAKCCIKANRDKENNLVPCNLTTINIWNKILPTNKKDFMIVL